MRDYKTSFELFKLSLNEFPNSDLQMHASLLMDLSETVIYRKCCKLQSRKCLQLGNDCLLVLNRLIKLDSSAIFLFPFVFHQAREVVDLEIVFNYFVETILKSNSKFSNLQLGNFNEFLLLFITDNQKLDLVLEKAEKQFLRSPESILKSIFYQNLKK